MPNTTRVERDIAASPDTRYRALIDSEAVRTWVVPTGRSGGVTDTRPRAEPAGVPDGVRPEDDEPGGRISLGKPTALVEGREIPA